MNPRDLVVVLLVILGGVILLPVLGMALWGFGMMGPGIMGPGMTGRWGWGGWGTGGLLTLLLLAAGVVLIILAFTGRKSGLEDALKILRRRLAMGEITKEQFEELKQALR